MSGSRRLLMVITSMARGGAERQVVDLSLALSARGWEVGVLSMTTPRDLVDELLAGGVQVSTLAMRRGRPSLRAFRAYRSFVRRWRPDVVHSHMVHANLLARMGRLGMPATPLVCTIHNVNEGPRWREVAYRLTDRFATVTTAVSRAAADRYVRVGAVPPGRVVHIPNGFDFDRRGWSDGDRQRIRDELGVGPDATLWVAVGRLVPAKGHDILLQAFARVRQERPDVRLAIAGEGPAHAGLSNLIAELGLPDTVSVLGERRDISSVLSAADAFVMPSRWEGLPIALLEAAAHGLPIVSTDVGGCREVVDPRFGGVLAEPTPESLSAAMLRVSRWGTDERSRTGRQLREHARGEFELGAVVTRWEALYASISTGGPA